MRLLILLLSLLLSLTIFAADFSANTFYQVCFTPAQKCHRKITNPIYQAKQSIEVQAYSFTSKGIAYALIKAQKRGVNVRVIVDKSELLNKSVLMLLLKHHVPVWLDDKVSIAHNKVMIFDGSTVLTGSYNFTNAAEYHNAENVLLIKSNELAQRYYQNWLNRLKQAKPVKLNNVDSLRSQVRAVMKHHHY